MSQRLHREACGAPGCKFVAGPSRDLARVQRIVDQHRATAHLLDLDALAEEYRRFTPGSAREYRRRLNEELPKVLASLARARTFERGTGLVRDDATGCPSQRQRAARRRRETEAAERLARLSVAAWARSGQE
jgi:hypothetical protein